MALFVQFSGSVKDASGNDVNNFRYRGYHKETNKWSDWYLSNNIPQYNINLGDSSWLSQSGTSNSGDHILLVIETLESNPVERYFSMFEMVLIGTISTYVQHAQVKKVQPLVLENKWKLYSPTDKYATEGLATNYGVLIYTGRVNERITAEDTFTDEHSWIYNGKTFRHVSSYYNQNIFSDRLGIETKIYDWGMDMFINTSYRTFLSVSNQLLDGVYAINVKVTNKAGLETIDTLCLRIKYNQPSLVLSYVPDSPNITVPLNISSVITDSDGVMSNVDYYFNTVKVASSSLDNYTWIQSLGTTYIPSVEISAVLVWSDGFAINTLTINETIEMTNVPPDFTLLRLVGASDTKYTRLVVNNPVDIDGKISDLRVKWQIDYMTPLDNQYKPIYVTEYPLLPNSLVKEILLETPGNYRAYASVVDSAGGETVKSIDFVITENSTTPTNNLFTSIEWGY